MRLLLHHRIASADGQLVHLSELSRALRELGHVVEIVGPRIGRTARAGDDTGWVHALKRRLPRALYEVAELGYSLPATLRLWRAARRLRPDAIYERHNLHLHAGRFVARLLGIPLLVEVNAPLAHERGLDPGLGLPTLARWSEASAWRAADVTLPVTRVLASHIADAGVSAERIEVIPNGARLEDFAPDRLARDRARTRARLGLADEIVLGFVGFVRAWHGLSEVLDVMAAESAVNGDQSTMSEPAGRHAPAVASQAPAHRQRTPPLVLLLVGDGPARAELEAKAERLGIAHRLHVTGFVDRDEIPAWIAAFDLALQPAATPYASPLKLWEYLAAGVPVIAPETPNLAEVLTHGRTGWLFDPAQPGALGDAIARVAGDAHLRSELGAAGQSFLASGHTWRDRARRVIDLVEASRRATSGKGTDMRHVH